MAIGRPPPLHNTAHTLLRDARPTRRTYAQVIFRRTMEEVDTVAPAASVKEEEYFKHAKQGLLSRVMDNPVVISITGFTKLGLATMFLGILAIADITNPLNMDVRTKVFALRRVTGHSFFVGTLKYSAVVAPLLV